jgi:acyl-CoA synthetase (AMP-forming)/AMP-acid ligase II
MRQAAQFHADRVAVVTPDTSLTFREAWRRGVRLANGLRALGVQPGDRVAGVEDNNIAAVDLLLGCAIAGAVRVPLYARNSREVHSWMLEHTGVKVLFSDTAYVPAVKGLDEELPLLEVIVFRDAGYEDWLASQSELDPDVELSGTDDFIIRHSGGTTGKPKGVAYTHEEWLVCGRNWLYPMPRLTTESAIGHAGAISHASGYLFVPGWLHGASNVLFGEFDPSHVLDMMSNHSVSHMFAAPAMLRALATEETARRPWPSLRALIIGSAPITDATATVGRQAFGDTMFQLFGQTEALPLSALRPEEWFSEIDGSIPMRSAGRVLPFAEVQIWDEEQRPVAIGEEGEIVARVEAQMRGYWNDEQLTAERCVKGWVRTGDVGRLDHNGFLYVLDRADDLIISGGYNIWPAELETVLADHPGVIDVVVFGIPDPRWGETPLAVCQVTDPESVTPDELIALCASRIGSYKKPGQVVFTTDPFPRSPVGKVQRKVMREPYWVGHDRRVAGV